MKLHPVSLGLAAGLLMGIASALFTLIAMHSGYGHDAIKMWEMMHPGYTVSFMGVIVGFLYSFVEGFIWFFLGAHLYNYFSKCCHKGE